MFNITEIFSNFLILRLYLPGVVFITLCKLTGLTHLYPFIADQAIVWTILPIVIGQFFHLIQAMLSLIWGWEHLENKHDPKTCEVILSRVTHKNARNAYKKNADSASRIFHFAQLYSNLAIALAGVAVLLCVYKIYCIWFIFCVTFTIIASLCSYYNYQYGRAILAHKDYYP
jgi:hypothetical protein